MNKSDKIDRMIEILTTSILMKLDNDDITSVDRVELFFDFCDIEIYGGNQAIRFDCVCDFTSEHLHNQIVSSVDCALYEKPDFNIKKLEKRITKSIKVYLEGKNGTTN